MQIDKAWQNQGIGISRDSSIGRQSFLDICIRSERLDQATFHHNQRIRLILHGGFCPHQERITAKRQRCATNGVQLVF